MSTMMSHELPYTPFLYSVHQIKSFNNYPTPGHRIQIYILHIQIAPPSSLLRYTSIIIIQPPTKPTPCHLDPFQTIRIPTAPPSATVLSVFIGGVAVVLPPPPASIRIPFVLVAPPPPPPEVVVVLLLAVMRFDVDVAFAGLDTGRAIVVFPITNSPPWCIETGVPEIVTPGPPAVMVVPLIAKAVGFGVNVWPAIA